MARTPYPKPPKKTTINVRDVPEELHVYMRKLAIDRKCSLGLLYAEAIQLYRQQQQ